MHMADEHEVLTVTEVCELLRARSATVYKMIKQGRIPSFRIGTDWQFLKARIERWMAAGGYGRSSKKMTGGRFKLGIGPDMGP